MLNHLSLCNSTCRVFFNGLVRGAWNWFRYRVSVVSPGSQSLREGEDDASRKP